VSDEMWDIWRDGFAANGDGENPPERMHAEISAPTFREACIKAFEGDKVFKTEPKLSWWSCGLHPTREECWDPTAIAERESE
jgi:hypothetical protein